jgi:hypothetical protein
MSDYPPSLTASNGSHRDMMDETRKVLSDVEHNVSNILRRTRGDIPDNAPALGPASVRVDTHTSVADEVRSASHRISTLVSELASYF